MQPKTMVVEPYITCISVSVKHIPHMTTLFTVFPLLFPSTLIINAYLCKSIKPFEKFNLHVIYSLILCFPQNEHFFTKNKKPVLCIIECYDVTNNVSVKYTLILCRGNWGPQFGFNCLTTSNKVKTYFKNLLIFICIFAF